MNSMNQPVGASKHPPNLVLLPCLLILRVIAGDAVQRIRDCDDRMDTIEKLLLPPIRETLNDLNTKLSGVVPPELLDTWQTSRTRWFEDDLRLRSELELLARERQSIIDIDMQHPVISEWHGSAGHFGSWFHAGVHGALQWSSCLLLCVAGWSD